MAQYVAERKQEGGWKGEKGLQAELGWAMLQAYFGLPRTVGLDLTAEDIDVAQPLPALAVAEVDSLAAPGREDPQATRYLCLTADNRCAHRPFFLVSMLAYMMQFRPSAGLKISAQN